MHHLKTAKPRRNGRYGAARNSYIGRGVIRNTRRSLQRANGMMESGAHIVQLITASTQPVNQQPILHRAQLCDHDITTIHKMSRASISTNSALD
jgi:hypothetical protein